MCLKNSIVSPKKDEYACIIIGDEILDGHVDECNMSVLIYNLYPLGYRLQELRIVSDDIDSLSLAINEVRKKFHMLITIGGLGATHDDRTMAAFSKSFQQELVIHQDMLQFLYQRPRTTKEMQDAVTRMSTMPKETEIIQLDDRWPIIKIDNCFALPGLPSICKVTIEKLAKVLPNQNKTFYKECFVNIREYQYFSWLETFSKKWKAVTIGSYPIQEKGDIVSKISITGKENTTVDACYNEIITYFTSKNAIIT